MAPEGLADRGRTSRYPIRPALGQDRGHRTLPLDFGGQGQNISEAAAEEVDPEEPEKALAGISSDRV